MPEVVTLPEFYASEQGKKFAGFLNEEITKNWAIYDSDKVTGIGFCEPYQPSFKNSRYYIDNSIAQMDISQLPFRNSELDKAFAMHLLENCANPVVVLQEIWRALEPDGELLLIVPNKNSMWRKTVIAGGYELSGADVEELLISNKFQIQQVRQNIFYPPKMKTDMAGLINRYFPFGGAVSVYYAKKVIFQNRGRSLKVIPSLLDKLMTKKNTAKA